MSIRVTVTGQKRLGRALLLVPKKIASEARDEMRGRKGIGVDIKKQIAKTFRGADAGKTRRGQKWIYSTRQGQNKQQLVHLVAGRRLNDLTLTVAARRRAIIHETGGLIRPRGGGRLAIPIGEALTKRGTVRRSLAKFGPRALGGDVQTITTGSGRTFLIRRDADGNAHFYFELVSQVRIPGGRFAFHRGVKRSERNINRRLERASARALRSIEKRAS